MGDSPLVPMAVLMAGEGEGGGAAGAGAADGVMPASSAPVGAAEAVLSPERSPNMPPEAAAMRERGGCRGEMPKCKLGRKGIRRS